MIKKLLFLVCFIFLHETLVVAQDGANDPTFNPPTSGFNFTEGANGTVRSIAVHSDGKIIMGGEFTAYKGVNSKCVVRLNADGTIDPTFNVGTGTDQMVRAVVVQADGKVIIGGNFTTYNGASVNRIARLNTDGSLDPTFVIGSGFNNEVRALAINPDGNILCGGFFTFYNGLSRNRMCLLSPTGTMLGFFANMNNVVYSIAVNSVGKIAIGGEFTTHSFSTVVTVNRIAYLNSDGTLDGTFVNGAGANNTVNSVAFQSDGKLVIGGFFTAYNGTGRNRVARINANGSVDGTFNSATGANNVVFSVAVQTDNKVLIGGEFTTYGGATKNYCARINSNGTVDNTWENLSEGNGFVYETKIQSDGKILVGGAFTFFAEHYKERVARVLSTGGIDATFSPSFGASSGVFTSAIQSDGKILIGGTFSGYNGNPTSRLARLTTTGTIDGTFNVGGSGANNKVQGIAVQADGKIIVVGSFTLFNGVTANRVVRLNPNGTVDATFVIGTGANNIVNTASVQADGKIILGGYFTSFNGVSANRVVRLTTTGAIDPTFTYGIGADNAVWRSIVQPDGKILLAGEFTSYNGSASSRLVRLNSDGTYDASLSFGLGAQNASATPVQIYALALQSDGGILIGGTFTKVNGINRNRIARVLSTGILDTSFDPGIGFSGSQVVDIAVQGDGKIVAGGSFPTYHFSNHANVTRILPSGAVDPTFSLGAGTNSAVRTIAIQSDGKIILGGDFTLYRSEDKMRITRLINCIPAVVYPVQGSGSYCTGGSGLPVSLANSQVGFSYQLQNSVTSTNVGSPVAGTGSSISFGNQTAGTYIVIASNAGAPGCPTTQMSGSAVISATSPVTPTFTAVSPVCAGASIAALQTTSLNGISGSWSPAINNMTTTTYTFTPSGGCANTTTLTITVNPIVTPTFNAVAPICAGATLAALPTTSLNGITGTWSPALNNTATTTYTFTPTAGVCANTATMTITVNPIVTPTFAAVSPICSGVALAAFPTTSLNGITGTWSPAPNNTATTTYTFTPTAGLCASTTTRTITVNPNVTPTFPAVAAICTGGSLSALPTTSINGITGTWSPALNNTATTTYTFTPTAGQCANTATKVITVNPIVTPTFAAVSPICAGATLSAFPTTSLNGITGTWSPALNNTATTTYTFTPTAGQCANTATLTITVTPNGTPTFASVASICSGESLSALPTTSLNGFAGTWSPALNNMATTTYTFAPNAGVCATSTTLSISVTPSVTPTFSAVSPICTGTSLSALPTTSSNGITGTWSPALNNAATTTYTFTPNPVQCAATASLTITVNPLTTPTFTAVAPICSGASLSALPTTSLNGITGTWSPALNNTATTTYTFTPTAGQCASTATLSITVNAIVTPTFAAVSPVCSGATLSALPTTSTNGITGSWSPALNNTATTTYTFTPSAGQCATTATTTITVNSNEVPTFAPVAAICIGSTLAPLPTTSTNGISGTWSPALNNSATTTYTFTPTAGQCATPTTLVIAVNPLTTPTFVSVSAICAGDALAALPTTSVNGITGIWSPALDNSQTTTYTFTPAAGQCASNGTLTITVNPIVAPTFNVVAPICSGEQLTALPTSSLNGVAGTWSPVLNNTATTTYTFTPTAGQCASSSVLTIQILQPSNSTLTESACSSFDLNGTTYTATGVYTQTIANAVGCDSLITLNLTITSNSGIDQLVSCGPIEWIDGIEYDESTTTPTFTLTNAAGCDSVVTLNLTIQPLNANVTLNAGILTATATGVSYQWNNCATSTPIVGETSATFIPTVTGTYSVTISTSDCEETSVCTSVTVSGVGIEETEKSAILVFPNPANGEVFVSNVAVGSELSLLDASGRLIQVIQVNQSVERFDLNAIESGTYFIRYQTENNTTTSKMNVIH